MADPRREVNPASDSDNVVQLPRSGRTGSEATGSGRRTGFRVMLGLLALALLGLVLQTSRVDSLAARVQSLEASLATAQGELRGAEDDLRAYRGGVSGLRQTLGTLESQLAELEALGPAAASPSPEEQALPEPPEDAGAAYPLEPAPVVNGGPETIPL